MFRDLDAMGHVNNAVHLAWLEQVRNTCYLAMMGRVDPLEKGKGLDFVVARAEVDYLAPIHFGDAIRITTWPVEIGRSSFALAYDGRKSDGSAFLRARTVLVTYDWEAARSKPLSAEVEAALRPGLGSGPANEPPR
jgi:acyl-CoA thioester hydrolase